MPSGPKKRRAARRKRYGTNAAGHEEDEFDAVNETGSKESQSVDQIALKSPPTVDSEHVEKSKDVVVKEYDSVRNNGNESVHDETVIHAPVMESVITMVDSSDSVEKKEKESESEPVEQILIQPSSKETKGNEDGEGALDGSREMLSGSFGKKEKDSELEPVDQTLIQSSSKKTKGNEYGVGEGAFDGAMDMVSDSVEKKEKDSEMEPVDQILYQASSKETEGNEYGEGASDGAMEMVSDSVGKKEKEFESEPVDQIPIQASSKETKGNEDGEGALDGAMEMISDSYGKKEKDSELEPVDQILIQPSSKETKGNEDGEGALDGTMEMIDHGFSVVKESEEISKEGVLQDPFEEPTQAIVDPVDQLVPKSLPLKEAQNPSVPIESVSEVNVETFIEDVQDSISKLPESSSVVDVSPDHEGESVEVGESASHVKDVVSVVKNGGEEMSTEGVVEDTYEEQTESSSREPEAILKTVDELVLKKIRTKEAQDSVSEVDVDTLSFEDAEESFETPLGSPSVGYMSQVIPLNEAQDPNLEIESVNEVNLQTSIKDAQGSFEELHGSSSLVVASPVEGIVENEFADVGESAFHDSPHVGPVLKEDKEISMESVLEEPSEELLGTSSYEPVIKTVEEAQDPSVPTEAVIEENVETHSKDAKDSFEQPVRSVSLKDVSLVEGVVQGSECAIGECACDYPLINHVGSSEGEKMSMKGVCQDPSEEPTGNFSHEAEEMVDRIDQLIMKATSLKETQDPFVPAVSLNEVDVVTSSKDDQDSYKEPLKSLSQEDLSPIEAFVKSDGNGNEPIGLSSHEQEDDVADSAHFGSPVMVNHVSDLKEDDEMSSGGSLDELQAIQKTVDESVSEANVETSLKDAQEYSFKNAFGSSFVVKGNEYDEVGENERLGPFVLGMEDDEDMSIDGVLEEPIEEPIVKTVDQSILKEAQETYVQGESAIEVNVETSLKEIEDSFNEPPGSSFPGYLSTDEGVVEGKESLKDHESATMVNHVELVMEETKEMSIEGVLETPFEEIIGHSSNDQPEVTVKTFDQYVLKEAQDPSSPTGSVIDVLPIEGVVQGNEIAEVSQSSFHVVSDLKDDGEMSMESVLEDPVEDPTEDSLDELQEVVKTVDQLHLKGLHFEEVHDPLVIDVNQETSSEDSQDSFETPPGSPYVGHVSLVEGLANESIGRSYEPQVMVKTVDESDANVIPLKGAEDTSVSTESFIEANIETFLNDAKDTSIESLRRFSHDDVSSMEGVIEGKEGDEVGESEFHGAHVMVNHVMSISNDEKEVSMEHDHVVSVEEGEKMFLEGVHQYPFEEPIGDFSHEPQDMDKVVDQDPLEKDEPVIEVNVETSLKDVQDSIKEPNLLGDVSLAESNAEGKDYATGGESEEMVNHVGSIMMENEEMSIKGVVEEPFEEIIGLPSHEREVMVKTFDQSILNEAQDPYLPAKPIIEVNVKTSVKDSQDSLKEPLDDVSPLKDVAQENEFDEVVKEDEEMSIEGVLQDTLKEPTESSSHDLEATVKTVDQLDLNVTPLKETQLSLLVESAIEVKEEKSIEDAQDLLKEPLGSSSLVDGSHVEGVVEENECVEVGEIASHGSPEMINHVVSVKEDVELSMEGNLQDPFEEPTGNSLHESQAIEKTDDQSVLNGLHLKEGQDPSVRVDSVNKVNVDTSFEDAQDSFETPLGRPSVGHMSSHEPHVSVKQVDDQVGLKVIPMEETQEPSLETVTEVNIETLLDAKETSIDSSGSFSNADMSSMKGVVQGNEYDEVGEIERSFPSEAVSMEGVHVLEESFKEPIEHSSDELQTMVKVLEQSDQDPPFVPEKEYGESGGNATIVNHVESLKENEDLSLEDVLEKPFEMPVGDSSHEQEAMVNTIDRSFIEVNVERSFKDAQDYVPMDNPSRFDVFPVVDTSFEDAQDSFKTPLGSPSVGHMSSHEPHVMFKPVDDQVGLKVIPMEENQEPYLETVTDVNIETLLDAKEASINSLGSFSMADVSSMEGVVQGNEYDEVGEIERSFPGEAVSMEGVRVLEESFKEPIGPSSDELQTMVKVLEQSDQDPPFVPEYGESDENATIVNHVESLKENEDLSIEDVLEKPFEKPVGDSSHEQEAMVNTIDESFIEVNVERSFKDAQDYVPMESPSRFDVFPVEGIAEENEFEKLESASYVSQVMVNHRSSSVVNVSHVSQRTGQRSEMVGLVRTLLEEIRRIRAFYEEGLRQTTQIHMHMSQVLEKFDSDELT
ncbi:hypothetical protein L1887_14336 [Cichorium endivia]|nr:hypothetical protein L1887_14336 [Cichorium endivia]